MEKVFHHDYEGEQRKFFEEFRRLDIQENPQNYREIECKDCKKIDVYNITGAEFKKIIDFNGGLYCVSCAVKIGWKPNISFCIPDKYLK